ncbi:MAG: cupin domain-containing protein [Chloroflexi bacterium]|nr:cupin domain-containing protein [Chloroflexota bacterium]
MRFRPTAGTLIARLGMLPHPEGGHYVETWRADAAAGARPSGSAILFLLRAGERSAWHRVDAAEIWHFHAGDPLELSLAAPGGDLPAEQHVLGPEILEGQSPQIVVPPGGWQSARTLGSWTLVGCTVSPAFRFETFELAPPGWEPGATPEAGTPLAADPPPDRSSDRGRSRRRARPGS